METFIFDWWWRSHQSLARKGFRIFRFCVMSWKDEREPTNQILSGKTSWRGSKVHHNTELWRQLVVSQWNSSGIFSQDSPHCSSATKSKSSCQKWAKSQNNFQDGSSSCRCSTTSHRGSKDNEQECELNAKFMRKGFHQENGYSSDLDQKRSAILFIIANHKENGRESQNWWWSKFSESGTPSLPFHESIVPRNAQKQRWWKIINTLLRIVSINQLSIYGAVSDLREEYKSCHVRTGRLVLAGQSDPLFVPTSVNRTPSHVTFSRICQHSLIVSHVTLAQGVVRVMSSMLHARVCLLISLRLSTLHSLQSLSSSFFILLIFIFIFYLGRFGREVPCALPRMRSWALWPTTHLSQQVRWWKHPTLSTDDPAQEDLLQRYQERVERLSQQNRVIKILYWCRIPDNGWCRTVLHDKRH